MVCCPALIPCSATRRYYSDTALEGHASAREATLSYSQNLRNETGVCKYFETLMIEGLEDE